MAVTLVSWPSYSPDTRRLEKVRTVPTFSCMLSTNLTLSGACSHILVLEKLITDQQGIEGYGFIGFLHMF